MSNSAATSTKPGSTCRKALEPDEGYYIQHALQIGGRKLLDLKRDPPPDLVLDVEGTRSPLAKSPVYAALGIPEIWHYDGKSIRCLRLGRSGSYELAEMSLAFPFLRPTELERFLAMLAEHGETAMMRAFQTWVRSLRPKK